MQAGIVNQVDEWRWSSCPGYYGKNINPSELLDCDSILRIFSANITISKDRFKEFNERNNNDKCLDDREIDIIRLSDGKAKARIQIRKLLGTIEIAQVKSLPKEKRNEVLRKVKELRGYHNVKLQESYGNTGTVLVFPKF